VGETAGGAAEEAAADPDQPSGAADRATGQRGEPARPDPGAPGDDGWLPA
jgi:hypothetical protein